MSGNRGKEVQTAAGRVVKVRLWFLGEIVRLEPVCPLIYQMTFKTKGPVAFILRYWNSSGYSICTFVLIVLTFHVPDKQVAEWLHCTALWAIDKTGFANHLCLNCLCWVLQTRLFVELSELWCCPRIWIGILSKKCICFRGKATKKVLRWICFFTNEQYCPFFQSTLDCSQF